MVTSIQLQNNTLNLLKKIKDSTNAKSYDAVITNLVKRKSGKSMAGVLAGGRKYSVEEIVKNLRDKRERF